MLKLYKNIRELRLSLKMSQQELADLVGYKDRTSIAKVEAGEVDLSQSKINAFAKALGVSPIELFGWNDEENPLEGIRNISTPDAYAVPVLGRICCGDGVFNEEESCDGFFVLDKSIRADFCLEARGDSMTDAGIDDGDRVFLRKTTEYEDGRIYGVLMKGEDLASLKRVYRLEDKLMLQPCNSEYHPQILPQDDVFIIGECVGVYKII